MYQEYWQGNLPRGWGQGGGNLGGRGGIARIPPTISPVSSPQIHAMSMVCSLLQEESFGASQGPEQDMQQLQGSPQPRGLAYRWGVRQRIA